MVSREAEKVIALPWLKIAGAAAVVVALLFVRNHYIDIGYDKGHAELVAYQDAVKEAITKKLIENAGIEAAQRQSFQAINDKLKQENANAKQYAENVSAELRAGKRRLREHWAKTCPSSVPSTAANTAGSDDATDLRERDFGHLVSIGKRADDQVKACQATLTAERQ